MIWVAGTVLGYQRRSDRHGPPGYWTDFTSRRAARRSTLCPAPASASPASWKTSPSRLGIDDNEGPVSHRFHSVLTACAGLQPVLLHARRRKKKHFCIRGCAERSRRACLCSRTAARYEETPRPAAETRPHRQMLELSTGCKHGVRFIAIPPSHE